MSSQQSSPSAKAADMKPDSVPVSIDLRRVMTVLVACVVLLAAASTLAKLGQMATGGDLRGVVPLFALNAEANIPTFFSGMLLLGNAALFFVVWSVLGKVHSRERVWAIFGFLFVFLAFDEMFQVHEKLIEPIRDRFNTTGLLYFAWFLVYGVAAAALAVAFLPRWWRLEPTIRWLMAGSAACYLAGAIGFEMIGGAVYEASGGDGGPLYALSYTLEETLEMLGLVLLMYTLGRLVMSVTDDVHFIFAGSAETVRSTAVPRVGPPIEHPNPATSPASAPAPAFAPAPAPMPVPHPATRLRQPAPAGASEAQHPFAMVDAAIQEPPPPPPPPSR